MLCFGNNVFSKVGAFLNQFFPLFTLGMFLFTCEVSANEKCVSELESIKNGLSQSSIVKLCSKAKQLRQCSSGLGTPIYHFDYPAKDKKARNILVFSLVHGNELESGAIALRWMERLSNIESRSKWRVVPVLNPDGLKKKTRTNANGVDLNRNFPSKDWEGNALTHWKKRKRKDPRRYPGPQAASEVETKCAMDHLEDFNPDFVISVHTPYGVLDFDGPSVPFPKFAHLPWVRLGTYPGSLGRYMWKDKNVPVLTIELKDDKLLREIDQIDLLQDISGTVAIRAHEKLNK